MRRQPTLHAILVLAAAVFLPPCAMISPPAWGAATVNEKVVPEVGRALLQGSPQDLIVQFDDSAVRDWAAGAVRQRRLPYEDAAVIEERAARYRTIKRRVHDAFTVAEIEVLRQYEHLPLSLVRVRSTQALNRLVARGDVTGVFRDGRKFPTLDAVSASLVGQPAAGALGFNGSGSTVLVIDSGVDYTLPEFGSCSAPGTPSSCKVSYYIDLTGTATQLDHHGHGTNVSGIVIGVAPGAKIAMANVFGAGTNTSDSLVLQAINWGIANRSAYNIRAINLSLGDGGLNTAPCQAGNPYYSAIQSAFSAGIITTSSSGNEGYTNGIANPACTPNVVSVGAVYSANWGGLAWSACSDGSTAADKVICFSNSASFLTALAPGALISAGGLQMGGTSQASAFVAGAVAVLRSGFPSDTLAQTIARLTSTGVQVADTRNGIVKPRLNLGQSVRPVNDLFANRIVLSGSSGSATGTSVNASTEPGEPNHAGNVGGASIWWKWTAPAAGQAAINTSGSSFGTLLAVYTGTAVSSLAPVAATTSGAGGLLFQAQQGTEYQIAVDGNNGAAGNVTLNRSLNTAAAADLALTLGVSSGTVAAGGQLTYTITVRNNGPQAATGVAATDTLPAALAFVSASSGCAAAGAVVSCSFGTLASGSAASAGIVVRALTAGSVSNSASASSALPDPSAANNVDSVSVTVTAAAGGNDSEVPTLPQWAMLLLALFLGSAIYARRHVPAGPQ